MSLVVDSYRFAAAGATIAEEVLADTPIGYWKLDETSGTTAADSSGNGLDGTYTGTYTLNQSGPAGTGAFQNSTTGHVLLPDNALYDIGDVGTVECWVKRVTTSINTAIISFGSAGSFYIRFGTTNALEFLKAGTALIVTSTTVISDTTTWHHVAATKNGATSKLYIDGVDVTGTVTNATMTNVARDKAIGGSYQSAIQERQTTVFAHAAFYGTALSAARILAHYEAGS